ncbi:Morc, S5 domain 2-like, partial [Dillenia turbinata]
MGLSGSVWKMSSLCLIDSSSDDETIGSNRSGVEKRDSSSNSRTSNQTKKHKVKKLQNPSRHGSKQTMNSNAVSTSQSNSNLLDREGSPVDESSHSSATALPAPPICRKFWKAGNYDMGDALKLNDQNGKNHLRVHPLFLHSNATSHKWVFGAIAELLDNSVDEIHNGATFVFVDKTLNPRDGSPALLIQDDGGGMDPEVIRHCMSFGFSDKKSKSAIGHYGNGFKTSSMRLGADVIVFSRHLKERVMTQSVGLLSYTFLRQTGYDRIVVPVVDYKFNVPTETFEAIIPHGKEHFSSNLSVLLQWSPFSTEEELLKQFDEIGPHGTKVVIYNLWLSDDGITELDFDSDPEDIRISGDPKLFQTGDRSNPISDQNLANRCRFSLRAYSSILYFRLPSNFTIILRGKVVEHHNIVNDLKYPEVILYRPQLGRILECPVYTTIGFLKDAPYVNVHGFNVYHRNRLILPFWRVVKNTTTSCSRGVVGILEANFVQPTHNKQDFEKTSLFQKLEARLKDMALEDYHCGLIGYQQIKKTPQATVTSKGTLPSERHIALEQPVLLNPSSPVVDKPRASSSAVEQIEGRVQPPLHIPTSRPESNAKRKGHNPVFEQEHAKKKHAASETRAPTNQHHQGKKPVGDKHQNEELRSFLLENKKLRSQLLELGQKEAELNLKVLQLRNELEEAQKEFKSLLEEDGVKMEEN